LFLLKNVTLKIESAASIGARGSCTLNVLGSFYLLLLLLLFIMGYYRLKNVTLYREML